MDMELLERIKQHCTTKSISVACAESITLGRLTYTLGSVPGASKFLLGGVVAYQDSIKQSVLGVPKDTISKHGAVSPQTCLAMLKGIKKMFNPTIALATTGYAGPRVADEPVGLVFIGLAINEEFVVEEFKFSGSREEVQTKTVEKALEMLWEKIEKLGRS